MVQTLGTVGECWKQEEHLGGLQSDWHGCVTFTIMHVHACDYGSCLQFERECRIAFDRKGESREAAISTVAGVTPTGGRSLFVYLTAW